ncbi:MBL fold metallo-hydrolase [uncultured Neglectibacter sp.]|uniref:MBL fold metallo-hydrolase n=1 Tax=uncultured Neglectibacter sp. TaxID=1924108 RepID=UPI0034DE7E50
MNDWFTIEPLDKDTYAISEYRHWEETHCYLLLGTSSALLIDTGLGVSNIKEEVDKLTDLPITVATTHAHWDHIGGHGLFGSIAVHRLERNWLAEKFPIPLAAVKGSLLQKACDFPPDFSPNAYQIFQGEPQLLLEDGTEFDLGNRIIQTIYTPGHSPGHCCFYEPERQYLFSGDLLYRGCLYAFYPTTDPLLFYQSVQKVNRRPVSRLFPGHHDLEIPVRLAEEIEEGFSSLECQDKLKQGNGLFDFGSFQIHI